MAKIDDIELKKAIASNPNTPTKVLLRLINKHPQEVLNNSILPLLLLENPNLLNGISNYRLQKLLLFSESRSIINLGLKNKLEFISNSTIELIFKEKIISLSLFYN